MFTCIQVISVWDVGECYSCTKYIFTPSSEISSHEKQHLFIQFAVYICHFIACYYCQELVTWKQLKSSQQESLKIQTVDKSQNVVILQLKVGFNVIPVCISAQSHLIIANNLLKRFSISYIGSHMTLLQLLFSPFQVLAVSRITCSEKHTLITFLFILFQLIFLVRLFGLPKNETL